MAENNSSAVSFTQDEDDDDLVGDSTFVLELNDDGFYKVSDVVDNPIIVASEDSGDNYNEVCYRTIKTEKVEDENETEQDWQEESMDETEQEDQETNENDEETDETAKKPRKNRFKPRIKIEKYDEDDSTTESFPCDECDYIGKSQKNLKTHRLVHQPRDRQHKCKHCEYTALTKKSLRTHMLTHEGDVEHACPLCDKVFSNRKDLRQHRTKEHPPSEVCDICGRVFASASTMTIHKQVKHLGRKKYTCEFCGKTFYYHNLYESHRNGHLDLRPYQCGNPGCNRTYRERSTMLFHQRKCAGQTSVACEICGMVLKCDFNLKTHMEGHHGNKKYTCVCGKEYKWQGSLSGHRRRCPVYLRKSMPLAETQDYPEEFYIEVAMPEQE